MSNLTIYYLSLFKDPVGIAKTIERLQILYGSSTSAGNSHLVRWDVLTTHASKGSLRIGKVASNKASSGNSYGDSPERGIPYGDSPNFFQVQGATSQIILHFKTGGQVL